MRILWIALMAPLFCSCAKSLHSYAHLRPGQGLGADTGRKQSSPVRITYLGTNGYLLQGRDQAILIDPYFSRHPAAKVALNGPIDPDPQRIQDALERAHAPSRIRAILVTHGHFDHLLDVPWIQRRYGGDICASPTSCHLARAQGVDPAHLLPLLPDQSIQLGSVRIECFAATHDKLLGRVPYPGTLDAPPPRVPQRPRQFRCGVPLSFVVTLDGKRIYVDSGGTPKLLPPRAARGVDVAILGAALNGSQRRYADAVAHLRAGIVIPSHQDNFFLPLDRGFRFATLTDFESILETHRRASTPSRLVLMDYFDSFAIP